MSAGTDGKIHVEALLASDSKELAHAALVTFGVSLAILAAGFLWLGREGMLDPHSPDFFPLPHFCAFVGILLAIFFLIRSFIHGRRYGLFGTSVVEGSAPVLGERFAGTLRIAKPQALRAPITLRICCDWRHYIGGAGSTRRRRETTDTLWESSLELATTGAVVGIPFQFDLPEDGLPTGRRPKPTTGVHPEGGGDIHWVLRALSPRPGTDYYAEFEVDVRPGKRSAELAREARPATAKRSASARAEAVPQGARLLGSIAATLSGGRMPSAAELRAEEEAESRPEPETPFASQPWQDRRGPTMVGRIALGVGLFVGAIALYTLSRQAVFGRDAGEVPATITQVERNLVTLDLGADDPRHKISVSSFHHWDVGQRVQVLCETGDDHRRRCRMSTGFDRWIDGWIALAVSLLALTVWRRARPAPGPGAA